MSMQVLSRHQLRNLAEWYVALLSIPRAFEPRRVQLEVLPPAIQTKFIEWVEDSGRDGELWPDTDEDGAQRTCAEKLYYDWLTALILGDAE